MASAAILLILPLLVAIDLGGVLWWTQALAAMAIGTAFVLALPTLFTWSTYHRPRQMLVLVPLLAWFMYSQFQTAALSPGIVEFLSPGSYEAYTQWLEPILPAQMLPSSFSISVAPDYSAHAAAWLGMMLALAWTAVRVFNTRARVIGLLSSVAITGAIISVLGVISLTLPELPFFDLVRDSNGKDFSTFINRNNAALTLNLGLAASLGLLGWRLSALTGQEIDGEDFEIGELFALASDRDSAIGLTCAVLCVVGLLVCGSRGGLGAAVLASTVAFGWLRNRRGWATVPVAIAVVGAAVAFLIVPLQLDLESIKRLEVFTSDAQTLANDGRLQHWPEGWQAGLSYLPGGSGLSSYAYAYLPYQNDLPKSWFLHADNLWLELFVEQGLVGISLALVLLAALIWCLTTISVSHDALDHGIRITGWYCIVAVLFSQSFDFGLILPANLIMFVLLMAGVVSRSSEAEVLISDEDDEVPSLLSRITANERLAKLSAPIALLVLLASTWAVFAGTQSLNNDAALTTAIRAAQMRIAAGQTAPDTLLKMQQQVQTAAGRPDRVDRQIMLAQIDHRLARAKEVAGARPSTSDEATELYRITSPLYRRLIGRNAASYIEGLPPQIGLIESGKIRWASEPQEYQLAADQYRQALARLPLATDIRSNLISLDFLSDQRRDDPPLVTETLLTQLGELHRGQNLQISGLATLAAQGQMNDLAQQFWNHSLVQAPTRTTFVLRAAQNYKDVDLLKALPTTPSVMRTASREITTRRMTELFPLLPTLIENLGCEDCETIEEKTNCLLLEGKAWLALQRPEEAIKSFTNAVAIAPAHAALRLELIATLRSTGDRKTALQQARMGRQITPDDKRFENVIKQMAAIDLSGEAE
ncbi:O-Antigen ligase [Rubripirellula lacrimiformis]|uniref:O-Antigen ligase n=1 Tax=Rubripirellula lacrimiformis TaxID=1930273 RepID=A0A517N934_9BACT|nr:O-antigen ligase family protein [Rubripirellula lacrimiformis]QDT03508.1 O-Antigen ligase [Rubripirellula lacrimiformis]